MLIKLDLESEEPIYIQLKHQIIAGIAKQEILPGDRLPSVRSLAADIGINLHTVSKSYQQLKQEGFILIHRQKGVVVNPEGVEKADAIYKMKLEKTLYPLIAESVCRELDESTFINLCSEIYKEFKAGRDGK